MRDHLCILILHDEYDLKLCFIWTLFFYYFTVLTKFTVLSSLHVPRRPLTQHTTPTIISHLVPQKNWQLPSNLKENKNNNPIQFALPPLVDLLIVAMILPRNSVARSFRDRPHAQSPFWQSSLAESSAEPPLRAHPRRNQLKFGNSQSHTGTTYIKQ